MLVESDSGDMKKNSNNLDCAHVGDDIVDMERTDIKCRYVGETSRHLRDRAIEHYENLRHWKKESFWVEHWLTQHGTETTPPDFKFEVVVKYNDPMRRQLAEALLILNKGDLNRRNEYNSNEVCRLAPGKNSLEIEKLGKELTLEKLIKK